MDTIGDFLTVIRNGVRAGRQSIDIPASKQRVAIAETLKKAEYVNDVKVVKDGKQGVMRVFLNYNGAGQSKINGLRRMSRPGRRYYVTSKEIPNVRSGYGLAVVSTSRGVMSGGDAKKQNIGGELICIVW
ncbi:MAG: 30S ribosomal protein S8 [Bdellovibrionaceae bacterium]|nr:30S ribosomal protein S8 [Pseudobdellovibrionaceae bacterium]